ncbi:hypothetical protein BACCAP_00331 [Pseudoflavonifractor capillosus ATCC 29799]|uniref:Uncharacterized protein n=1 Tax=Pseudoflavonifractor capillosus ATCC 29799 TaxID=411467 RepID=A6NQ62_9FIRM|nr:hypothetical protein BACCAP_00331 [Pseudoflavonifractor capillosus ATCC 29799]
MFQHQRGGVALPRKKYNGAHRAHVPSPRLTESTGRPGDIHSIRSLIISNIYAKCTVILKFCLTKTHSRKNAQFSPALSLSHGHSANYFAP